MLRTCGWIEGGTRGVLEQVIPIRRKHPHNVWAWMSRVTSNNAVSYPHLIDLFRGLAMSMGVEGDIFDHDVTTDRGPIAIDSTKGEVSLYNGGRVSAVIEDAAADCRRITRDGAVAQRERAVIEDAAFDC